MAKISDIVQDTVDELRGMLDEIESNEEDDIGTIADSFDEVAQSADKTVNTLHKVEEALGGSTKKDTNVNESDLENGNQEDKPKKDDKQQKGKS